MIHAQRPDATACAEYDFWMERMGRYVRRGSRGIALLDTRGDEPALRYVFDVADTGTRRNSRTPYLWDFRTEHQEVVSAALTQSFGASSQDFSAQLEQAATALVRAYWRDHGADETANGWLEQMMAQSGLTEELIYR